MPAACAAAPSTADFQAIARSYAWLASVDFCNTTTSDASITARTQVKASPSLAPSRRRKDLRIDQVIGRTRRSVERHSADSAARVAIMERREARRTLDPARRRLRRDPGH